MTTAHDVVVTGLGATTPLGGDVPSTWSAALAGESGARSFDNDWAERFSIPVSFAATLKVPSAEILTRPELNRMDPSAQYAVIAAREAWADAGSPGIDGDRLGAVVSSGIGGIQTILDAWDTMHAKGARRVLPMTVPMLMPNSPTAYVSLELGARAGAHALVSACASGAEAIGYGAEMIRTGRADVVIAGGTEAAIHPMPIAAFAASRTLSTRNDDPGGASRPYDVERDGFVLGEGAGILLLEREADARARGARIYAAIVGYAANCDALNMMALEESGQNIVVLANDALKDAGLSPADVQHISAHGTSTVLNDRTEARAFRALFGPGADGVAVTGLKSMTGHAIAASGDGGW